MILFLILTLLIAYAAICAAKMDVVDDRWSVSYYSKDKDKYDPQWFHPYLSWRNKYIDKPDNMWLSLAERYLPQAIHWLVALSHKRNKVWSPISDFWHWEKAKMVVCLCVAIALGFVYGLDYSLAKPWGFVLAVGATGIYGLVWNLTFTYWYNRKLIFSPHKRKWLWLK